MFFEFIIILFWHLLVTGGHWFYLSFLLCNCFLLIALLEVFCVCGTPTSGSAMLAVTAAAGGAQGTADSSTAPPSVTNAAARGRRTSQRVAFQRRVSAQRSGRRRASSAARDEATEIRGIAVDRLTYMNTALDALPGLSLREYFVPIMRLKKQLLLRQRATKQRFPAVGSAAYAKLQMDAITALAKALGTAGADLLLDSGGASLDIDPKALAEALKGKLTPICMEAGSVLSYPREPPEASFVYVVLSGAVTAMHFQPQAPAAQQHRTSGGGGGGRKDRQMYFTSAKDVVRLCGGGMTPDAALFLDDNATLSNNGGGEAGAAAVEAASMSNVTTAIQRSLRRASRTVGQPTLQYVRMEQLRGVAVLGASEAIGLAPCKYVSYMSSTETSAPVGRNARGDTSEVVQAFRLRTSDVHAALLKLAAGQQAERQDRSPFRHVPWCTTPTGDTSARAGGGGGPTIADFIVAARRRTLYNDYAAMELMMRQSWLLQDAPSHTIRTLIAHLEPRIYMPGEVIACPHTHGGERQLCFLRRGRLNVYAVPKVSLSSNERKSASLSLLPSEPAVQLSRDSCECWHTTGAASSAQPAEVVESGASFGELSVLFQEPRHCVLRAATVCDTWCLPHRSFTSLMQRDASLRDGLLQKAAVLRIQWMSEQRFTRALAQQLRAGCEMLHPLPDISIRLIQERLEPVVYAPGSLVVSTSTKCDEMIFIMHGTVTTICAGVATYGPGDVLGEGCLVPHRWPLGLAARSMVEGWRIKADQLSDAFRRMDKLHRYSGLVTSQTLQIMKQIFGTPLPEIEVDAVGRQRMPTVSPAPGRVSFLTYARAVSEVQLKAACILFRDYVRWEDINYATIDGVSGGGGGPQLDKLARALAIQRLDGGKGSTVAAALSVQLQQQGKPQPKGGTAAAPTAPATARGEGSGKENDAAAAAGERSGSPAAGSGRSAVRASSARTRGPSTAPAGGGGVRGPRTRVASAGAFLIKRTFLSDKGSIATPPSQSSGSGASATTAASGAGGAGGSGPARDLAGGTRERLNIPLPPRLQRMTRLLEERNRTWTAEQRHEATLVQQETNQREAAVRDQVALHASSAAAAHHAAARGQRSGATGAAAAAAAASFSLADVSPAPVHIFLQADKPKYELDLKEAISIGYVMQLPDITHIQYSVSLVDPDVALGPPAQRGRRHLMSVTPNDRYSKHNFLFAAAAIEDGSSAASQKAAAAAAAEATLRSKARKLYVMMRTAVAARMDLDTDPLQCTPHRTASSEYSPDTDSVTARPAETLMLADELLVRSPMDAADGLAQSPPIAHCATPPKRGQQTAPSTSAARSSSMATPSPYRTAAGKNGSQRAEEALHRLLQRDPVQAIDALRKHYGVPWSAAVASGQSSPARFGTDSRSVNGSGFLSTNEASAESPRRGHRPSLLERLEMAAAGGTVASPDGLPRVLPARDAAAERHDDGTPGELDVAELTASGEVVLTNNTAPTFPPLVRATARDRWHGGNHLALDSAPPAAGSGGGDALVAAAADVAGTPSASASAAALSAVAEAGTLADYFYGRAHSRYPPALFVEGYGPLAQLADNVVEYPPAIQVAATAASGSDVLEPVGSGSLDRAGAPSSGARLSRPGTAIAAAAALRRSASRAGNASASSFRGGDSVGGHGGAGGGEYGSVPPARRTEPFVMPSLEDTEVVIRRIQRDVNGLNAVAREQRRERDGARLRNGRVVKHRAAVEAALGRPDEHEQELLETWRGLFGRVGHDAMRRASVPCALREEAGPDYMKRELRHLASVPVPMEDPLWRYTSEMQAWQEQRGAGGRGDTLPVVSAGAGGGGQDGPRRVVATIGTSRLGFTPAPLQSPTSRMTATESQQWARQREDFFAAYKQLLEHPTRRAAGGTNAQPLTPPAVRFTPAPPPPTPQTQSPAPQGATVPVREASHTAAFSDHLASTPPHRGTAGRLHHSGGAAASSPLSMGGTPVVPSVPSAASLPSIASPPIPAVETSADFYRRHPKPDLPARYESTPSRSYNTEAEAQLTPSAVDNRVALTPPRERWTGDDTQDYMEGPEEYSSGALDDDGDEEEAEEEDEHSAVLGGPDTHETTREDSQAGNADADADADGDAGGAESDASVSEGAESTEEEAGAQQDGSDDDYEEAEEEEEEEELDEEGEEEEGPEEGADAVEENDQPAWLDI